MIFLCHGKDEACSILPPGQEHGVILCFPICSRFVSCYRSPFHSPSINNCYLLSQSKHKLCKLATALQQKAAGQIPVAFSSWFFIYLFLFLSRWVHLLFLVNNLSGHAWKCSLKKLWLPSNPCGSAAWGWQGAIPSAPTELLWGVGGLGGGGHGREVHD